jgi:hypothetical protein
VPTVDDELTVLLTRAAVQPTVTSGVLDAVHTKRRRRAARRRVGTATAALALVVAIVAASVWVMNRDDDPPVAVAPPPVAGRLTAQVDDDLPTSFTATKGVFGSPVAADLVSLDPDRGYVRGPVVPSGEFVAVASYDRSDRSDRGFTFPPSRVVRIDEGGRVLDEIDLQGEVISLADGEGARWVLTRDAIVLGPEDAEFRVKRIGPGGDVASAAVPPGQQPVGALVAGGGGVWVPVADGVLRFDAANGAYAGRIDLPPASHRTVVAFGKGVFATTSDGLARLDPSRMTAAEPVVTPAADGAIDGAIVDAATGGRATWALVDGPDGTALVAVDVTGGLDPARRLPLPDDLAPERLAYSAGRLSIVGRVDGRPALVSLREHDAAAPTVERVAVLDTTDDAALALTARDRVVVATDGRLWVLPLD